MTCVDLGEVIGPCGPLFFGGVWVFRDRASLCATGVLRRRILRVDLEDGTPVVFVELIPITTGEASGSDVTAGRSFLSA